jgi:putative nucleotidyltransferase with HDIG domain
MDNETSFYSLMKVQGHDYYTYVHSMNVCTFSVALGTAIGLPKKPDLEWLGLGAMLHDVGKALVDQRLINKPGRLTEEEFKKMKDHVLLGYNTLRENHDLPEKVYEPVLQHHERWDGSGYPNGLKGGEISLFARTIAIADTYYALVSRRPHRREFLPHEAIEFIMAYSGELFDPELVQLFSKRVPLYPTGVTVKLNGGEVGFVTNANVGFIGRPVVRVVYDEEAKPIKEPFDVDLKMAENQKKLIVEVLGY